MLSTIRHEEIFNPKEHDSGISIIGAGAIGSRTFATLVELGLQNLVVYDHDKVEPHNLANQLFTHADVGYSKVSGCATWAANKLGIHVDSLPFKFKQEKVTPDTDIKGTVFLLVDSLETRRELASSFHGNYNIPRVIDTRMASTHGVIYTFSPHTKLQEYLATLGKDKDAEVSACGSPFSVAPTAAILANLSIWQYIHSKNNPEAGDEVVSVFLKPLTIATSKL
jgi:molybdopterin/thiamine biosynthesis adenylyltransferase